MGAGASTAEGKKAMIAGINPEEHLDEAKVRRITGAFLKSFATMLRRALQQDDL